MFFSKKLFENLENTPYNALCNINQWLYVTEFCQLGHSHNLNTTAVQKVAETLT